MLENFLGKRFGVWLHLVAKLELALPHVTFQILPETLLF